MNTVSPQPITSRALLALLPGSFVTVGDERFCLVGNPWVEDTGKPGIHRVRMNVLPMKGQIADWVNARGWHKASFYFRSKTIHGDKITAIEPQERLT